MSHILFYVSGHGYGHAVRIAEVIRAVSTASPLARITVRTTAPEALFREDQTGAPRCLRARFDPEIVEQGVFRIDWRASVAKLAQFLECRKAIVEAEAAWVRRNEIHRIVADIPFLAGEIAHAAGVPCIGIGNFLWDWIYEPMLTHHDGGPAWLRIVREAYLRYDAVLRLPFAPSMSGIRTVIDVPLVARVSTRPRADILTSIGVGSQDHRPLVLLSLRAGVNGKAVNRLAVRERDIAFLHVGEAPAVRPKNLHPVTIGNGVTFADLASIVDVVVGKPGYGTIAACVANRNRFLYVPREGFREDEILLPGAAGYVTTETLPLTEFETGEWGDRLRRILGKPEPERRMEVGGAQVCAEFIAGRRQDELRFPSFA